MDDDHVLRVAVQPGLLRLADGAHLVQGWRVQLGPAHVHDLQRQKQRDMSPASVSLSKGLEPLQAAFFPPLL